MAAANPLIGPGNPNVNNGQPTFPAGSIVDSGNGPQVVNPGASIKYDPSNPYNLDASGKPLAGTGNFSVPPPATTTPTSAPTVGDLYGTGSFDSQLGDAEAAKTSAYDPATIAANEAKTRADVLGQYQSQLDALDQAAAEARARITTQFAPVAAGRVGQTTAIEARRGLIGSDFGAAQTDTVNTQNANELSDKIQASDASFAAQKFALQQFIAGEADKEIGIRNDASQKGADAKIQEIQDRQARAQASALASVKAMIASGVVDPSNPNFNDTLQKIATSTNLSLDSVKSIFNDTKQAADAATLKAQTDAANLAKTQAETAATLTPEQVAANNAADVNLKNSQAAKTFADAAAEKGFSTDDVNNLLGTLNSYNGRAYITPTDLEGYTVQQKSQLIQAAKSSGIPTLSAKDADALDTIQSAKDDLASFQTMIDSAKINPTDWLNRSYGSAEASLESWLQTNGQAGAYDTWAATAIPLLTGLKGAGTGGGGGASRLFSTISDLLPQKTDTVDTAKTKISTLSLLLDNGAGSILGTSRTSAKSSSSSSSSSSSFDPNAARTKYGY